MRYAVIKTGGKQYVVEPGQELRIEKIPGDAGADVAFDQVLLACDEGDTQVGQPLVQGASVQGQIVRQEKATKINVFKKKRRKNYRRRYGHRQPITVVRVTAIGKASGGAENGS